MVKGIYIFKKLVCCTKLIPKVFSRGYGRSFILARLLTLLVVTISFVKAEAQDNGGFCTPNAVFDTLRDRTGKKYLLRDLQVNPTYTFNNASAVIATSCTAGYFNIYFAVNSGFDQNTLVHQQKRDVICKLFTDLSNWIVSPLTTTGVKVKILIADPAAALLANPAFVGGATELYYVAGGQSGIADPEIYKTIISGIDSYTAVGIPLAAMNGGFYHGMMMFNPSYNFNIDIANSTMVSQTIYDLYSVALHEATHMLGFGSLINFGGGSVFGAGLNYYSRYDTKLRSSAGAPLLSNGSGSCTVYNNSFTVNPLTIAIGNCTNSPSNVSNCGLAVRYVGSVNVPVFTPTCWMSGSSLSHFEDACYLPAGFSSTCTTSPPSTGFNDLYFVMSNAGGTGNCGIKRHLQPEEAKVLCDLGYSLRPQYCAIRFHSNHP